MRASPALALGSLLVLAPAARADVVRVGQVSAPRTAAAVEVPVSLENLETVGGFKLTITYDPSRLAPLTPARSARTQAFEIFGSNLDQPGLVVVVGIADFVGGGTTPPVEPGTGDIVILRFAPLAGVAPGLAPLQLVGDPAATSTSNATGTTLGVPELEHGWIQLTGGVATAPTTWGGVKCTFTAAPPAR